MIYGFRNNGDDEFSKWEDPKSFHPQGNILKSHIERAVQDIFYSALKSQSEDLLYIFYSKDQIDELIKRMVKYWESEEEYEKCSEIMSLGDKFKEKWETPEEKNPEITSRIKDWLKSSF